MKTKGFTLIELLAVIVILGIVVAIAIPGINSVISNSRKKSVLAEAEILHSAALRKLAEDPNFDFSIINKDNVKQYMETDGKDYDYLHISKVGERLSVGLKKYGFRANSNGKQSSVTNIPPHIALEYNLSLGKAFVNIDNVSLSKTPLIIYKGTYEANKKNIEKGFKDPYKILTNFKATTDLKIELGNTGIYTVISTTMNSTYGYHSPGSSYQNNSLIGVPNFDILELGTKSLNSMFFGAETFNQDISHWDTRNITGMNSLFRSAKNFDSNLDHWDTSKVTDLTYAFLLAENFNGNISSWDTSRVISMRYMFSRALKFNQNIGNWDVSKVIDMTSMFDQAYVFNQDISSWNTISVKHMGETDKPGMFQNAKQFNQNIGNWNVSNVIDMRGMFSGANKFNQDLSRWNVYNIKTKPGAFDSSATVWTLPRPIWGTNGGI